MNVFQLKSFQTLMDQSHELHSYLMAFFVLFGLLGNICILKVFLRKRFTKILQVKSFFRFLAITNSIYLLMRTLAYLDSRLEFNMKNNSGLACKLIVYLNYCVSSAPAWILAVISFERFVSVAFSISHLNSYMNKKPFQLAAGLLIVLINLIIYAPLLALIDLVTLKEISSASRSNQTGQHFTCDFANIKVKKIFTLVDIITSMLLPATLMFVLSVCTMICIKTIKIHSVASLHGLMLERKLKRDKRFAVVSILLSFFFVGLNVHRCFSYFVDNVNLKDDFDYSLNFYLYLNAFTDTFYVLFFFNSIFRDEFLIMVKLRKQKF